MNRLLTSQPQSLKNAQEFARRMNLALTKGSALRHLAVVVSAPASGFHVCTLGFASSNGLEIVR